MRILIDMDGVIADFELGFLQSWRTRHPGTFYVPLEGRSTFYVKDNYPEDLKDLVNEIYWETGFFRNLPPIHGAQDALTEMEAMGFEVFICSSPLRKYQYSTVEKYEWVEMHLGFEWTKRLILTRDKTLVKGDILIDDKPVITGAESSPAWEHILYDQPYNREIKKRRITWEVWKDVLFPK